MSKTYCHTHAQPQECSVCELETQLTQERQAREAAEKGEAESARWYQEMGAAYANACDDRDAALENSGKHLIELARLRARVEELEEIVATGERPFAVATLQPRLNAALDRVEALEAKCALYAASLRTADARAEALAGALREIAESPHWIAGAMVVRAREALADKDAP